MQTPLILLVALPLVLSYQYFGNTHGGCPTQAPSDETYYIAPKTAVLQWWSVSFTDDTQQIGGIISVFKGHLGLHFVQIGVTVKNEVFSSIDSHLGGWHEHSNTSFCVGGIGSGGCLFTDIIKDNVQLHGASKDNNLRFNLHLTGDTDRWCLLNKAKKQIHLKGIGEDVSWYHYIPGGPVTGFVELKNNTKYTINGVGQTDHVWLNSLNPLGVFKNWIDGHFYNASEGTNCYWGNMPNKFEFVMLELPQYNVPQLLFWGHDNVDFNISYFQYTQRPARIDITGQTVGPEGGHFKLQMSYAAYDSSIAYKKGENVEDIVYMSGHLDNGAQKFYFSALGWAQLIGGKIPGWK